MEDVIPTTGAAGASWGMRRFVEAEDKSYGAGWSVFKKGEGLRTFKPQWRDEFVYGHSGKGIIRTREPPKYDEVKEYTVEPKDMLFCPKGIERQIEAVEEPFLPIESEE